VFYNSVAADSNILGYVRRIDW